MKALSNMLLGASIVLNPISVLAKTEAVVNLNVTHSVNGKTTFDRKKYITIHSTLNESDWEGEQDKLKYMMEDLDVYFGRDNGSPAWNFNQARQDAGNIGYADPAHIKAQGKYARETGYGKNKAHVHQYDGRGDIMVGGQPRPHWFGAVNPCCGDPVWQADGAEAVGDFLGQYINEFYRSEGEAVTNGHLRPTYFEVLNEPLYQLTDAPHEMGLEHPIPPIDIFNFHKDVAVAFRQHNQDVKIGGFTVAFPIFEERNFARWNERMKLFIDTAGPEMDFFSTHFYDLEDANRFKGSRIEATLDMIDHYSLLRLGETKEHVISEYGGRNRPIEKQPWTPYRDWYFLKTASPMMMQFMDRPDSIGKAIPFVTTKALWGTRDGIPYNWRLLRQAHEGAGEEGDHWVFTEMVKFYELWSEVKGTRVDSYTTNPDILIDSYVDKDKAYVIFSNLTDSSETLLLHQYGAQGANIQAVNIKHLYLKGDKPILDEINAPADTSTFELAPEATLIVEYTYSADIPQTANSFEKKYFATEYLKEIAAETAINFEIRDVLVPQMGEVILRLAVGRDHGTSLAPEVTFNGELLQGTATFAGDAQRERPRFFGLLEIPVSLELVKPVNQVSITFPDTGGHVASVNMKVFSFDSDIRPDGGAVNGMYITPDTGVVGVGDTLQVNASVTPFFASNQGFSLASSDDTIASVSQEGVVRGLKPGNVTITATSDDGGFVATSVITVEAPVSASLRFDDSSTYVNTTYSNNGVMQVTTHYEAGTGFEVTSDLGGVNYLLRHMNKNWGVISDIKVTDSSAVGKQRGTSTVSIPLSGLTPSDELTDGEFYFLFVRIHSSSGSTQSVNVFPIHIEQGDNTPTFTIDDVNKYRTTEYEVGGTMEVTTHFDMGTGNSVDKKFNGVRYLLRHMRKDWAVVKDIMVEDSSVIGTQSGTSTVSIPLTDAVASAALPDGDFYFLYILIQSSDGSEYNIPVTGITLVSPKAVAGDWDGDTDVDYDDVRGLMMAIQARQDVEIVFDLNRDGVVNILDARAMMAVCTRAQCAIE